MKPDFASQCLTLLCSALRRAAGLTPSCADWMKTGMIAQSVKDGISDGTAIGLSAGVLGIMYSLAALEVGLQPMEIIFYCAIVYSAAVQFTAFGAELSSVTAVLTLVSGAAFVCTRNVLMSLDMARHATGRPIEIIGLVGLVDAGWASARGYKRGPVWPYFWSAVSMVYAIWMTGSILGALVPVPDHPLIDGAFQATPVVFFALMITLLWRQGIDKRPHLASMGLTVIGALVLGLPPTLAALIGASISAVVYVFLTPAEQEG